MTSSSSFRVIKNVREVLDENLFELSTPFAQTLMRSDFDYNNNYGILVTSRCKLIARLTSQNIILNCIPDEMKKLKRREMEEEIVSRKNKFIVKFTKLFNTIEIDAVLLSESHYDKYILIDFLLTKMRQKCLNAPKHVFLIHNIEQLPQMTVKALQNVIEKFHEHAYFVFTCSKINYPIQTIVQSMCTSVKNNIDTYIFLEKYINKFPSVRPNFIATSDHHFKDNAYISNIVTKSNDDIINVAVLWEMNNAHLFKGHLSVLIENVIDKMLKHTSSKCHNDTGIDVEIRSVCDKIATACVPFAEISKIVINYMNNNKNIIERYDRLSLIYNTIQVSSKLEMDVKNSNKELFGYELYFHTIYKLLLYDDNV